MSCESGVHVLSSTRNLLPNCQACFLQPYTYLRKRSFRPWAAMAVTNPTIIQLPGILSRSRLLALSLHGRRQWTVKRFDIRVRARSGQLRGAASNFEAGEVGTGKREGGLPAHQAARAPRLRASRRLPKWALIILNRSFPASSVFEFFCLGKTRSTSLPASGLSPLSPPCGH